MLKTFAECGGTWRAFGMSHRIDLVVLSVLVARGRATPPSTGVLKLLFPGPFSRRPRDERRRPDRSRHSIPGDILWHILSYWRSDRDGYVVTPRYAKASHASL